MLGAVAAVAVAAVTSQLLRGQNPPYDVVIRGGHIVDGSGNPWFAGDVAIRNGRIAAVGRLSNAAATRVIDATGRIVSPGLPKPEEPEIAPPLEPEAAQHMIT